MTKNTKETAGKIVTDILSKDPELIKDPIDEARSVRLEMQKDYVQKVENTIQEGLKTYSGDFFVVVEGKREKLMPNVIRNFIFHRNTCPTPHYDQTVYHYHRKTDEVEFLWVIPDKRTCEWMKKYPLDVPESERDLLNLVYDFYDDNLLEKAKILNKEVTDNYVKEIYG